MADEFALRRAAISASCGGHRTDLGDLVRRAAELKGVKRFLLQAHPQHPLLVAGPCGSGKTFALQQSIQKFAAASVVVAVCAEPDEVDEEHDVVKEQEVKKEHEDNKGEFISLQGLFIEIRVAVQAAIKSLKLPSWRSNLMQNYVTNEKVKKQLQQDMYVCSIRLSIPCPRLAFVNCLSLSPSFSLLFI